MSDLTVGSFNLHWGRGRRATGWEPFDVIGACRELDADVLVLQESWAPDRGQADHERVAEALGMRVAADVGMARLSFEPRPKLHGRSGDGGDGGWRMAVLSRLPVTASRTTPLPHLWPDPVDRAVHEVEVDADGHTVTVCGVHLPHLEFGAPLITPALRRALPPADRPAVLLGDMNMWGWCISAMAPRGWRRAGSGRTWPAHRPHSRIDHVLVTSAVEVLAAETLPDLGSDHRPIRAHLRVT